MIGHVFKTLSIALSMSHLSLGAAVAHVSRDGSTPALTYDPNTTTYCTWWVDLNTAQSCSTLLSENLITLDTFRRWNPSITENCGNLLVGHSYCVEAFFEPVTSTTITSVSSSSTTTTTSSSTTTTKVPNGIETPSPTQPNIVDNCDAFYLVQPGDSCANIASSNGITLAQFLQWNPSAGSSCSGLWASAYACVSIIGVDSAPTTTQPGNGVATPTPTQAGMVSNCNRFHFVESGQTCSTIAASYSISVAQFTEWNPAVNVDCTGLWASTYACVGLIGSTTTTVPSTVTTTTSAGNGITTPTPTQPSMVNNCDSFYYVVSGDTCASIASKSGISLSQFVQWNPSVGDSCSGLWLSAYVCISIIGHTPTTTSPGNGVATPTPTQSGMTTNCKSFYFVKSGDTCASIAASYNIPVSSFVSWNPAVGSSCTGLWSSTYACVAVL